jgi:hypothetical protein
MAIGFALLAKLGLSQEEADSHKNDRPSDAKTLFVRDQSGIGYREKNPDFMEATDRAFARLHASIKSSEPKDGPPMTVKPPQQRGFIPARLRKMPITSLSAEDLACVLARDVPTSLPSPAEVPHRRRKHRRPIEQLEDPI